MAQAQDFLNGVAQGLSGVNAANNIGFGNSGWAANATVTLVIAAIRALAPAQGSSSDLVEKICQSLRNGQLSGAMSETHGVTTVAGARALFTVADPNLAGVPTGWIGNLAQ